LPRHVVHDALARSPCDVLWWRHEMANFFVPSSSEGRSIILSPLTPVLFTLHDSTLTLCLCRPLLDKPRQHLLLRGTLPRRVKQRLWRPPLVLLPPVRLPRRRRPLWIHSVGLVVVLNPPRMVPTMLRSRQKEDRSNSMVWYWKDTMTFPFCGGKV
jgi:hypothetical protein